MDVSAGVAVTATPRLPYRHGRSPGMSETFSYQLGRFLWLLVSPGNLILWLLLTALAVHLFHPRLGRLLLLATIVLLLAVAVTPVGQWLLRPLEQRFPASALDRHNQPLSAIVVLGGSQQPELAHQYHHSGLNDHSERLWAAAALAKQFPDATVLFVGGTKTGRFGQLKESSVAVRYFEQLGIPGSHIVVDDRSVDTATNAKFARQHIERLRALRDNPDSPYAWVLITSAMHMPRAVGAFLQQGLSPLPYPVNYQALPVDDWLITPSVSNNLQILEQGLHEWLGLLKYYLADDSPVLFPGPAQLDEAGSPPTKIIADRR